MDSILMTRRTTAPSSSASQGSAGRKEDFHGVTVVVTDPHDHSHDMHHTQTHRPATINGKGCNDASDSYRHQVPGQAQVQAQAQAQGQAQAHVPPQPRAPALAKTSKNATKGESWMARVSSAMSKRIFPKKHVHVHRNSNRSSANSNSSLHSQSSQHSSSRNTQVVPMLMLMGQDSFSYASTASDLVKSSSNSSLSSEHHVQTPTKTSMPSSDSTSQLVEEPMPKLDGNGHSESRDAKTLPCLPTNTQAVSKIPVSAPPQAAAAAAQAQVTVATTTASNVHTSQVTLFSPCKPKVDKYPDDETDSSTIVLVNTAPILKDFFSRPPADAQGIRAQQRETRRNQLYQTTKQRQDALRTKRRQEEQHELQDAATLNQIKKQEIKRRTQEHAQQRREEVAHAKAVLAQVVQAEEKVFVEEREQWESQFDGEIRKLTNAFHKARLRKQGGHVYAAAGGAAADCTTDTMELRPVTVGGLVVPEALSEIQRDAHGFEKRVQSASPRFVSRPPTIFAGKDEFDNNGGGFEFSTSGQDRDNGFSTSSSMMMVSNGNDVELLDSNDVQELFGGFLTKK